MSVSHLSPASQLCLGPPSVTGQHVDFSSLIYAIWLIYLLHLQQRKAIAEVWPRYRGFLVSLIIFQYFLCHPLSAKVSQTTCMPWALQGRRGAWAKADLALDVLGVLGRGARVPGPPLPWRSAASRDWEAQPLGTWF